jgi:small subunit ribosomal protein S18
MNNYKLNPERSRNMSKSCFFCSNNIKNLDYKDVILLRKFINTAGKILPKKRTGTCSKHQRLVAKNIKRARIIGLLPFVAK